MQELEKRKALMPWTGNSIGGSNNINATQLRLIKCITFAAQKDKKQFNDNCKIKRRCGGSLG